MNRGRDRRPVPVLTDEHRRALDWQHIEYPPDPNEAAAPRWLERIYAAIRRLPWPTR